MNPDELLNQDVKTTVLGRSRPTNKPDMAKRGYSRDGKQSMLQVNYGLLTDAQGCPVAISVRETALSLAQDGRSQGVPDSSPSGG